MRRFLLDGGCSFPSWKYIRRLVDEEGKPIVRPRRKWLRIIGESVAVLVVLLLIFHRPILLGIGHAAAVHFAAKANLKLDLRLEGSVFGDLVIRNVHATPTGPTIVESIDADYLRADYNLLDLLLHGSSAFLHNVEARGARVVLNPATAAVQVNVPPDKPLSLPTIFPDRIRLSDVNVIFRTPPQDFILQGLDLELNPKAPGELRIARLQLPTVPAWTAISGRTSYENKNLIIRDVTLDGANKFRLIEIDASKIAQHQLGISLDASLAGGTAVASVELKQVPKSLHVDLEATVQNISLDTLRGYIGRREGELTGTVDKMVAKFSGVLSAPRSWVGHASVSMRDVTQGQIAFDRAQLEITAHDGVATLERGEIVQGSNSIQLKGTADLPNDIRDFGRTAATVDFGAALPQLRTATAKFPQPLTGALNVTGHAEIRDSKLEAKINFKGGEITSGENQVGQVSGTANFTKQMPPPDAQTPYYADLHSDISIEATDVQTGSIVGDVVRGEVKTDGPKVSLDQLTAVRKQNTVTVSGEYQLPQDFANASRQPATINFRSQTVETSDYFPPDAPHKLRGPLQVDGQLTMKNGRANGQLQLSGGNLHFDDLPIPAINAKVTVTDNVVQLHEFAATLGAHDSVRAQGTFSLDQPHAYSGQLHTSIADLKTLEPLLAAAGNKTELAGALSIDWQGSGTAANFQNSGSLKLALTQGRYANLDHLQANIDASYTPEALDVPLIFFRSDKMDFQASLQAKGETLEISKIQIDQGQAKYATGYISVPFIWKNVGSERALSPENGQVAVNIVSENLDLKKLFEDIGQKPVVSGLLNVKIDAKGTLADLSGRLEVQARELRSEVAKLEPATFELSATLQSNQLAIAGKFQQAKIQPVAITANLPLNVAQIVRDKKFDENTPLTAKVQMPRSSVNFARQFVPAITQLDGDMALDVNVSGTVAKPVLSGAGDISVNVARFANPTLPALTGFKSRLTFAGDTLTFERFDGQLAGGPFRIGGRVSFPKLTEPMLDFQLKADSVLVARNDSLTARADADVRVTGPLKAASVTGNVALTNSQFLKNIDLIPIGLPGRPAPQPPAEAPNLSFPNPPIRDWKFDVAIKTKDPFLIRGNLANGGAIVDLHLTGTGLHPGLEGQVRLENVEATLPFSRLQITQGFLYFDPSDSLNPKVDLQGTSLIRDYTIHVYVYGTTPAPEVVFTSEPPLPQEEIISLLATGTTREELPGNNNVLAGRA
ncbi:MAG: translocation/assembly module TamB domain-containing protein, partial [Verrucomicrobiota bacterium]|nr:translocation/assembly module TamB domain-containing protein [Verrucomicrobiota bacterium]